MRSILTELHYFPNIQFLSKLRIFETIIIDDQSLFVKQTYRNRTEILSANKVLSLVVPVKKGKSHLPMKEVKIDYSSKWQKEQFQSLRSAYNNSPYYLHFIESFRFVFEQKHRYLFDLDLKIFEVIKDILELQNPVQLLSQTDMESTEYLDFRNKIHPKKKMDDPDFSPQSYYQVFSDKFGFVANLSTLDLIFNMGNEAIDYLD